MIDNGGKINLNTGRIIPNNPTGQGFTLGSSGKLEYTGPNFRLGQDTPLKPGYSKVQYYPSTQVLNRSTPTVPYDFMKSTNKTVASNPSLLSKLKGAGRFVGPALGLGEVFLGKTPQSKILGAIGGGLSLVPHPLAKALGTGALIGAGAVDTYSNPQSQIDKSNKERINFIAKEILSLHKKTIGIYKLNIKDKKNAKNSSIVEVINLIKLDNIEILIYDPEIKNLNIPGTTFISDLNTFKNKADIILANRKSSELNDVLEKIYSKDIFGE